MELIEILTKTEEQINENINAYNEALHNEDYKTMNDLDGKLKELEKEYADTRAKIVYKECLDTDNPIKTAITRYSYSVLSHKDNKEEGIITDREVKTDKTRQIDLLKMCKFAKDTKHEKQLPHDWEYDVEAYNQLLCLHTAKELKCTDAQLNEIATSYFMKDIKRRMDSGETPDSKTKLCKNLQSVVDKILFEADENGKNSIKVNNHDVAYILQLYAKKGKTALSVQCAKHDFMRRLVYDVIYRVLTNGVYTTEFKKIKADA